jgi:hypothetical protein
LDHVHVVHTLDVQVMEYPSTKQQQVCWSCRMTQTSTELILEHPD